MYVSKLSGNTACEVAHEPEMYSFFVSLFSYLSLLLSFQYIFKLCDSGTSSLYTFLVQFVFAGPSGSPMSLFGISKNRVPLTPALEVISNIAYQSSVNE